MKKIKIISTYIFAFISIIVTLIFPADKTVIQTSINSNEDKMMIFMLRENQIIPITLKIKNKDTIEENIVYMFELMKKGIDLEGFQSVVPKSIQLLNVELDEEIVKLNFNEALYVMNSKNELRFIEAIVNSVLQFNENFKIQFYVNDELIHRMPLSNRIMKLFGKEIGINNFKLENSDLYSTRSKKVVNFIENEKYSYHIIQTVRTLSDISLLEFINDYLEEQSSSLYCEKIENEKDVLVLHLNENVLYDENTIDENVVHLLYTLKINEYSDRFMLKVNDDIKILQGYSTQIITIHDLFLNVFEQ